MSKASIVDVAKMAGVSIATVSNVCTGNKYVSKELRQAVLDAIVKLNYTPNYLASSLRSQKSRMIAVMMPSYAMEYYGEMLQGIQDGATALGCVITTFETKSVVEREIEYIGMANELMASGIIILSQHVDCGEETQQRYDSLLRELTTRENRIPIVSVMRSTNVETVDVLLIDDFTASKNAVRSLISLGHRSIGIINGRMDSAIARNRFEGYKSALAEAGIELDMSKVIYDTDYSARKGYEGAVKLLKETDITALFTANDKLGMGAIKGAASIGKRVPDDISIIGYDGVSSCELVTPTLSTVYVSSYDLGCRAMQRLTQRLANETNISYEPEIVTPTVVKRESTAPYKK